MTREFNDVMKTMDAFFNDVLTVDFFGDIPKLNKLTNNFPYKNFYTEDDVLVYEFCLAGYSQDDLSINIEGEKVSIKAETSKKNTSKRDYIFKGITTKDFTVTYTVPNKYDINSVKADFKDGILKLVFKENDEKKPKTIKIG